MDNGIGGILYLRTSSGFFKILQVIFSLCTFICAMVAPFNWNASVGAFFNVTALLSLIYALVVLFVSLGNIASDSQSGSKIDLTLCILFSILIFSSATPFSLMISAARDMAAELNAEINDAATAAVVFQYLNGFAYLGNTLLKVLL